MGWTRFFRHAALFMMIITGTLTTVHASEETRWTPEQLLRTVQELEQRDGPSRDGKRLARLSRIATARLARETGMDASSGLSRAQEINHWIRALNSRRQEQRCDLVRLAYAQALSRMALLKGSNQRLDVDRAIHELRLFWALAPDAPYAPRNCMDPVSAERSIASVAQARLRALESIDLPSL